MICPLLALAGVLVVSPAGPHRSLGAAIAAAAPGDRIVVRAGVYREPTIVVDRRVEIVGEGGPVFDGEGRRSVLVVTADGVVIRGLVLRNTGWSATEERAALRLRKVRGARVAGNEVRDAFFGIVGEDLRESRIVDNRVIGPGARYRLLGNAIHCWNCEQVTIEGNRVTGHRDGVYLEFVRGSEVRRNTVEGNLRYGLHFMFSDSSAYRDNRFRENGAGVAVMYTRRVTIERNHFERSLGSAAYGLLLKEITDGRIRENLFADNTVALYLENSNRNAVEGNRFTRNGRAVRLLANSVGNVFRGNAFLGNSFDVTTNGTRVDSRFEANYWDRYRGYDLDRDGYGDVPFRPVRLFALLAEQNPPALALLRSPFVDLLDAAERVLPVLTPAALVDGRPLMRGDGAMGRWGDAEGDWQAHAAVAGPPRPTASPHRRIVPSPHRR